MVLGTLFDLRRFRVGWRASFAGLIEPSIGLRHPRLVVLCWPERTFFRSERAFFGQRGVGLRGSCVGMRGLCVGLIVCFAGLKVPPFGLACPVLV